MKDPDWKALVEKEISTVRSAEPALQHAATPPS
jgi:hypothetical protein